MKKKKRSPADIEINFVFEFSLFKEISHYSNEKVILVNAMHTNLSLDLCWDRKLNVLLIALNICINLEY